MMDAAASSENQNDKMNTLPRIFLHERSSFDKVNNEPRPSITISTSASLTDTKSMNVYDDSAQKRKQLEGDSYKKKPKLGLEFLLEAASQCEDEQTAANRQNNDTGIDVLRNFKEKVDNKNDEKRRLFMSSRKKKKLSFMEPNVPPKTTSTKKESVWDYVLASGRLPNTSGFGGSSPKTPDKFRPEFSPDDSLRKGRWTAKEEAYAESLIASYREGKIKLRHSMSLRKFLAECLHCDPMRISKKFPCLKAYKISSSPHWFIGTNEEVTKSAESDPDEPNSSYTLSPATLSRYSLKNIMSEKSEFFLIGNDKERSDLMEVDTSDDDLNPPSGSLRRGRWTVEEEEYADAMTEAFKNGQLPLPGSTSLRKFLADVLRCHPMRVSKKFVGCVRKYHYYQQKVLSEDPAAGIDRHAIKKLHELEQRFLDSLKTEGIHFSTQEE